MKAGQKAMAKAMAVEPKQGQRTDLQDELPSDRMDVPATSLIKARFVKRHDPELAYSVLAGVETLNAAYEAARNSQGGPGLITLALPRRVRGDIPMAVATSIRCRVCYHPQRLQIEQELLRGAGVREVSVRYRLPAQRLVTHYTSHTALGGAVVGEVRRALRW